MKQILSQTNGIIQVEQNDLIQLARLIYMKNRYKFMLEQRKKRRLNETYLEYVARFINANLDFEKYLMKLRQKYPEFRNINNFYFNINDSKIIVL